MDFEELDEYTIGMPNGREESQHGGYGWSTYTVWVESVEYYSPDELEPDAWPPGPYTPQPAPVQPDTGIKTKPLTTPLEPLAAEPQTVPLQTTTTTVVPVAPKRIAPLPPGPEPAPELLAPLQLFAWTFKLSGLKVRPHPEHLLNDLLL